MTVSHNANLIKLRFAYNFIILSHGITRPIKKSFPRP